MLERKAYYNLKLIFDHNLAETVGDSCSTHIETPKPQEASTESQQNTQKMVTVTAKGARENPRIYERRSRST